MHCGTLHTHDCRSIRSAAYCTACFSLSLANVTLPALALRQATLSLALVCKEVAPSGFEASNRAHSTALPTHVCRWLRADRPFPDRPTCRPFRWMAGRPASVALWHTFAGGVRAAEG